MELDVEEINLYGDKARAFRLSEGKAFAEAMRQKVARTLFYGDSNAKPDEFNGLALRYPSKDSPGVIDGGGTAKGKCTSMYLAAWGAETAHGIYPKGSTGGMSNEDLGKYMTQDSDGRKFQVVGDKYNWRCGLAVRDWPGCGAAGKHPCGQADSAQRRNRLYRSAKADHHRQEYYAGKHAQQGHLVLQLGCAHRAGITVHGRGQCASGLWRILRLQGRAQFARATHPPV